jgi:hypothetical protein
MIIASLLLITAALCSPVYTFTTLEGVAHLVKRQGCFGDYTAQCTVSLVDCFNAICARCADVPFIADCCNLASKTLIEQCIVASLQGATLVTTSTSDPPAGTSTSSYDSAPLSSALGDPGGAACLQVNSVLKSCESQTSGWSTEPDSSKASCFCYSSLSWQPAVYDGNYSLCLDFFSTASAAAYSSIVNAQNFSVSPCSALGDVRGPANASASPTTSVMTSSSSMSFIGGSSTLSGSHTSASVGAGSSAQMSQTLQPTASSGHQVLSVSQPYRKLVRES